MGSNANKIALDAKIIELSHNRLVDPDWCSEQGTEEGAFIESPVFEISPDNSSFILLVISSNLRIINSDLM